MQAVQTVFPALRITDYERSRSFYVDGLGFTIDWEHRFGPDFPVFMQLSREGQSFYLSQHAGDCQPGGLAYFYVPDVGAWYAQMQERGVVVDEPPQDQEWGNREMQLHDPDGNTLRLCTRLLHE
ncbi:MAG TPA: glyoxalase superfamily protein [Abditibacteriaceae bacterium]|jgi:catechol 2,3-dioxygenase-like lactoylglutathione lyase family enzyme